MITWTRWPATSRRQSSGFAFGKNSLSGEATLRRFEHLRNEILRQIEIVATDREQRPDIVGPDRRKEICERTRLKEFRREPGVRPEEERALSIHDPRIEMRHRHRRRTDRRFAIDLRFVTVGELRIVAPQPQTADREARKSFAFGNAGFLQQRQRPAARAEEHELRGNRASRTGSIGDGNVPKRTGTTQIGHAMPVRNAKARLLLQISD
jgi:hypothetical protein